MIRRGALLAWCCFSVLAADHARLDAWRDNLAVRQTSALLVMHEVVAK